MKIKLTKLALAATLAFILGACEEKKKQDGTKPQEVANETETVKKAKLQSCSALTVEEIFNAILEEPKWENITENGNNYVTVSGTAAGGNSPQNIFAKFFVMRDDFGTKISEIGDSRSVVEEACSIAYIKINGGTFTDDRDKKIYKTVKIGEQVWMAENLNYAISGSKCYGEGGTVWNGTKDVKLPKAEIQANCQKYGKLYSRETAMKACPSGWHLPSNAEWDKLLYYVDNINGTESPYKSMTAGKYLKAKSGWKDNGKGNGTDNFGFSALPGGSGGYGRWWSSSGFGSGNVRNMSYDGEYDNSESVEYTSYYTSALISVRCLQDDANYAKAAKAEAEAKAKAVAEAKAYIKANGGTFTDTRDEKTYKTIKIGKQVWMAENLNYSEGKCYDDVPANCGKYGVLYNWPHAMALPYDCWINECASQVSAKHKGICPDGWHLPSNEEWKALVSSVGGEETAGKYLKAMSGWKGENGEDKFGFSALPGGYEDAGCDCDGFTGGTMGIGDEGDWWSATEISSWRAYIMGISNKDSVYYEGYCGDGTDCVSRKNGWLSVRCVKD
jgi:uncharacterized protein (TIGR02145 family)